MLQDDEKFKKKGLTLLVWISKASMIIDKNLLLDSKKVDWWEILTKLAFLYDILKEQVD
mgnify:CR=1 FL=1